MNQLKNHKKILIQFDFDFQSLKPIEPNQTCSIRPVLEKKNKYK
jgi:hypothetical protein